MSDTDNLNKLLGAKSSSSIPARSAHKGGEVTKTSIYVDKDLLKQVKIKAMQEGVSVNSLINDFLRSYVE
jgi:predicted HicB family RNase H-like nuclease